MCVVGLLLKLTCHGVERFADTLFVALRLCTRSWEVSLSCIGGDADTGWMEHMQRVYIHTRISDPQAQ